MSKLHLVTIGLVPGEAWLWKHSALYRRWRLHVAFRRVRKSMVHFTVETQRTTAALLLLADALERAKVKAPVETHESP